MNLNIDPKTLRQLQANLKALPRRVGLRHFRIALNAFGSVIKQLAIPLAKRETGMLQKAIAVKVVIPDASWNPEHHGRPARVIVGPKRGTGRILNADTLRGVSVANRFLKAERVRLKKDGTIAPLAREKAAVRTTLSKYRNTVYRNPTRYAHLVEKGHGGPRPARAHPFIGPALRQGQAQGMDALFNKLRDGILSEAKALPK